MFFILDNIADNIFPPISKDIKKVCELGIVFHKKIKKYKEKLDDLYVIFISSISQIFLQIV